MYFIDFEIHIKKEGSWHKFSFACS